MPSKLVSRNLRVAIVFLLTGVGGCTVIPQAEFKAYTAAFKEVNESTEKLLLDFGAAEKLEAATKPSKVSTKASFPLTVKLASVGGVQESNPVNARRVALETVSRFNTVLTELAEGKKPEEIKSSIDSLIGGFQNVAGLVGPMLPLPAASSQLISTVIEQLEKAANRKQFADAPQNGEQIIVCILNRFALDAEDVYRIRAADAFRRSGRARATVTRLVRQMRSVAKEHGPAGAAHAAKVAAIEQKIRAALDSVSRTANTEKLVSTPGGSVFSEITLSQLDQTLAQVEENARKFNAVIAEQTAYLEMVITYGRLLTQTGVTLKTVRSSLDKPADIRAQAMTLTSLAFSVKRDWEALRDARRSASGS